MTAAYAIAGSTALLAGCVFVFAWLLGRPGNGRRRVGDPRPPRPLPDLPVHPGEQTQAIDLRDLRAAVHVAKPIVDRETTLNLPRPKPVPSWAGTRPPHVTWAGQSGVGDTDPTALPTVAHTRLMAMAAPTAVLPAEEASAS